MRTKTLKKGLSWMLCAAMLLTTAPVFAAPDDGGGSDALPKTVYIDAENGNDDTGTGTEDAPFASVQKGIDAIESGDTLYIQAGTYEGEALLKDKNDVTITGPDEGAAVLSFAGTKESAVLTAENCSNLVVTKLSFLPTRSGSGSFYYNALRLNACTDAEVSYCVFNGTSASKGGGGINAITRTVGTSIHHNHFSNTRGYSIGFNIATGNKIYNNVFAGGERGIWLYNNSDNNFIANNTFLNHTAGDFIYFSQLTSGNTFQNNLFASSLAIGEVDDKNSPISVNDILTNNTFRNNMFKVADESGIIAKDADGTEVTFAEAEALDTFDGNIYGDPLFLDSSVGTIAKNSPCVGAGAAVADVTDDFVGTERANPPAIGAYEPSEQVKLDTYYVDAEAGDDSNMGGENDPFQTVEKGLASLSDGKTLVIGEGTYVLAGPVSVSASNVKIIGAGSDKTVLQRHNVTGENVVTLSGNNMDVSGIAFDISRKSGTVIGVLIQGQANRIHDCCFTSKTDVSIEANASTDAQIYNIMFSGTAESAVRVNGSNPGLKIYNNLFESCERGVSLYNAADGNVIASNTFVASTVYDIGYYNATPKDNVIQNNIITKGIGELDNKKPMGDFLNGNTFSNNLFHVADDAAVIAKDGADNTFTFDQATELPSFQNNFVDDPGYAGESDFSLSDDSPAIDAGLAIDFITTDILGNPRDGLPDVGAYENQNAVSDFTYVSVTNPEAKQPLEEGIITTFTKPVDIASLEGKVVLKPVSGGDAVEVSCQTVGNSVLVTPLSSLSASTAYQLTIAAGTAAADGSPLKTAYVRTFTTEAAAVEDASLQIGTPISSYGRAHSKVPALSGDFTISYDYRYPSDDALKDYWVFAAYGAESGDTLAGNTLSPQIKQSGAAMTFTVNGSGYNLPYAFQGDTWYHLTLKFESGKFSFYINGVKQTFSNNASELAYPADQVINYIGYFGDLSGKSLAHDGMAYFDNFVVRKDGEVIFAESFNDKVPMDQKAGWVISPVKETAPGEGWLNYVGVSAEQNKEMALPVSITLKGENGRTGFMVGTSGNLYLNTVDSDGNSVVLGSNIYEVASKNPSVLTVEETEEGVFQAAGIAAGETEITVRAILNGKYFEQDIPVIVTETAELCNLVFAEDSLTLLVGNTATPAVKKLKTDGSMETVSVAGIGIESTDPDVATAAADGDALKVTALAPGETVVKLTLNENGKEYTAELPVKVLSLDRIEATVKSTDLYVSDTASVSVNAYAADGTPIANTNLEISLSSSNSDAIAVENGKLVAKAVGSSTITVSATFGSVTKTAEIEMNVKELAPAKTRSTIYTDEKRANAQENIEKYEWASNIQQSAVRSAQTYLDMDDEYLWSLVTSQMIPRSYAVTSPQTVGCLNCGSKVNDYGNYPYIIDSAGKPWKLTCPNCKMVFPTNDFKAYYEGGLDEEGFFNPDLAKAHNDELIAKGEAGNLVNILYPEKGESWGVDDGTGYIAEDGQKYTFVAYYNHEGLWHGGTIINALNALREAYLYTGDVAYANKGVILLDRIADVYPDLDLDIWNYQDGYLNSNGNSNRGKAIGSIWETGLVKSLLQAYDAFYPALADDADNPCSAALAFLATKNPGKANVARVRVNIEDGIVREVLPAVKRGEIRGNSGMHQSALAYAAVVLDSMPESQEWLDFDFQSGVTTAYEVTGGNINAELVNSVDRDGHGNEGAPGYNSLWLGNYLQVAEVLDGYVINGTDISYDLFENVKFRKMFSSMYPLILSTSYSPAIGDTGTAGGKGLQVKLADMVKAFDKFGDDEYAQVAYLLNSNSTKDIKLGIFDKDPEAVAAEIQNVIDTKGEIDLGATNLTGFGFTALRDGKPGTQVSVEGDDYTFSTLPHTESVLTKYFESNSTLQLEAANAGDYIEFTFQSESAGSRIIYINMWTAGTYGVYDVYVNGTKLPNQLSFLGAGIQVRKAGVAEILQGENTIKFVLTDTTLGKAGFRSLTLATSSAEEAVPSTERDLWMYYGRTYNKASHGHKDALNIGVHAFGIDLMPDLGYPRYADEKDQHRRSLVGNTTAHNTVMVNNTQQAGQIVGQPQHFDDTDFVKLFDVADENAYSGTTDQYRRTSVMIRIDEENSYVIDLFRVSGGSTHRYSFHGAETSGIATTGLDLVKQTDGEGNYVGTLAGANQPYPDNCDVNDPTGARYFFNVDTQEGDIGNFTADYSILDTWNVLGEGTSMPTDIHLKLTMLGEFDKVTLTDAKPPENKPGNPSKLRYVFAERNGQDLDSCFTAVIEPYRGESNIASIEALTVLEGQSEASEMDVRAVKVTLTNGRIDYIVNALDENKEYTVIDGDIQIPFQGFFGVYSKDSADSETSRYYLNDGCKIGEASNSGLAAVTGTVTDFTEELAVENSITIHANEDVALEDLAGKYIYIENGGTYNAAYRILSAETGTDGDIVLDIGDVTTVRSYIDDNDFGKGYVYDIAKGSAFRIPFAANNNLAPSDLTLSNDTLTEPAEMGDLVGKFIVTDPDDTEWTYSLPEGEENFKINGQSLYLAKTLNSGTYPAKVTVTDGAGNLFVKELSVTIKRKPQTDEEVPPNSPRPGKDDEEKEPISFTDLPDGHWAAEAIQKLAEAGILKGYDDGSVKPNQNASRAEFTSLVARMLGLKGNGELPFEDTDESAWYAGDVSAAVAEGLIVGWNGQFRPNDNITREEAMVIIAKAISRFGVETAENLSSLEAFTDAAEVSEWSAASAATLVSNGIIVGAEGKLNPKANITRAEISMILYQMKTKYQDK